MNTETGFGTIIEVWLRQQDQPHLNKTKNMADAIDRLCAAVKESGDPTPIELIAAHLGYGLTSLPGDQAA